MYQHLSLRRKGNLGVLDHLIIFVSSKEGCLIAVGFPLLYFPLLDQSYVSERVFTQTHTHMYIYEILQREISQYEGQQNKIGN